jgi:hypothetical protein
MWIERRQLRTLFLQHIDGALMRLARGCAHWRWCRARLARRLGWR